MRTPSTSEGVIKHERINRVEVIDHRGRAYVFWQDGATVETSLQDDGRTLKVFITPHPANRMRGFDQPPTKVMDRADYLDGIHDAVAMMWNAPIRHHWVAAWADATAEVAREIAVKHWPERSWTTEAMNATFGPGSRSTPSQGRCIVAEKRLDDRCTPGDCPTPDECEKCPGCNGTGWGQTVPDRIYCTTCGGTGKSKFAI